jgi:hypothetical protein
MKTAYFSETPITAYRTARYHRISQSYFLHILNYVGYRLCFMILVLLEDSACLAYGTTKLLWFDNLKEFFVAMLRHRKIAITPVNSDQLLRNGQQPKRDKTIEEFLGEVFLCDSYRHVILRVIQVSLEIVVEGQGTGWPGNLDDPYTKSCLHSVIWTKRALSSVSRRLHFTKCVHGPLHFVDVVFV